MQSAGQGFSEEKHQHGREQNGYLHERLVSLERQDLSLTRGKRSGSESRTRSPLCVWGTGLGRREVKKRGGGRTTIGKARTR